MNWTLRFLGVGNAFAPELGSACGVLERDSDPVLMIDCGSEALEGYLAQYGRPPAAIYLTHAHMDHVGGMERLFACLYFEPALRGTTRLFFHAALAPILQSRLADYPEVVAEGGANFWDAFSLVPVSSGFWHEGLRFAVFATRHHAPGTSYGVALPGSFAWTGDTRPIPEMLAAQATHAEIIAHDCGRVGNPSHTGLDDLEREYDAALRARLVLYHYGSEQDALAMERDGYRVARRGDVIKLAAPRRVVATGNA
jgi:glyoxylase-like metal-dependent hydrolase (beta-lactamase superfamily II)